MQILFIGQRGIPVLNRSESTSREQRVESLAKQLAKAGHKVAVICAKPFTSTSVSHYNGIDLIHKFSLHPDKPGGWIHLFLSFLTIWNRQPDVVHMHSWKAAALVRFAALLSPETTFVWTIDSLPQDRPMAAKMTAWQARSAFDAMAVPTRQLQYMLLHFYNIRATYVPDGYTPPTLEDAPVAPFGLRKNQYCLTTATTRENIQFITKAYNEAKTRKKLVVITENTPYLKRLSRKFSFLKVVDILPGRTLYSLIRQASVVIHTDMAHGPETTLQAMDSQKAIIATTNPVLEETLGTSASFVKHGDIISLTKTLDDITSDAKKQARWGRKARKRAQRQFLWSRVTDDYLILYHYPVVRKVPVDSLVKKSLLTKSVA